MSYQPFLAVTCEKSVKTRIHTFKTLHKHLLKKHQYRYSNSLKLLHCACVQLLPNPSSNKQNKQPNITETSLTHVAANTNTPGFHTYTNTNALSVVAFSDSLIRLSMPIIYTLLVHERDWWVALILDASVTIFINTSKSLSLEKWKTNKQTKEDKKHNKRKWHWLSVSEKKTIIINININCISVFELFPKTNPHRLKQQVFCYA